MCIFSNEIPDQVRDDGREVRDDAKTPGVKIREKYISSGMP